MFLATSDPRSAPFRGPRRAQILAHIERSRHRVVGDLARKGECERVAVPFGVHAPQPNRAAVNSPGQLSRDEVAMMRTVDLLASLSDKNRLRRATGRLLDAHIPKAVQVGGRLLRPGLPCSV